MHYFSNPDSPNLQAEMTLSPSPTHQMVIRIRNNGEYLVPRCATELIVPLLTHSKITWTFVGYNGKRHQGIEPYIRYLGNALNEVNLNFILIFGFPATRNNFGAVH